jgi:asparagine synthase (glutamine-hydrolysing)
LLAGAIEFNSRAQLGKQLLALANAPEGLAHIPFDNSDGWTNGKVTLVQQLFWNTPESKLVEGIACHEATGTRIVAWARIDNRQELLARLPDHLQSLARTDPGLILAGYLQWQDQICEKLVGDFCFAIYDAQTDSLYCGRDHLGVRPFYFYRDGENFVFASSIAILAQLKGIDLGLSEHWLAKYLLDFSQDWRTTVYQRIEKLPPASTLYSTGTKVSSQSYFSFSEITQLENGSGADFVEKYRQMLDEAVRCRCRSDYMLGSELSGGLDSATVTMLAARHTPSPVRNLHSFGRASYQYESERILSVSQLVPMGMTHLMTNTGVYLENPVALREAFFETSGVPEEHPNAILHNRFYQCAENTGIRTMLSGFGGDEVVTIPGDVALEELWQKKRLVAFVQRQPGKWLKLARAARWVARHRSSGGSSSAISSLANYYDKRWGVRLVNDHTCNKFNLESEFRMQAGHDSGWPSLNTYILEDRLSPLITARLENCLLSAARHRVEYRWPLLDMRLIRLFLEIPVEYKYGPGGITRYLHRLAVKDLVPAAITWGGKYMGKYLGNRLPDIVENRHEKFVPHPLLEPIIDQTNLKRLAVEYLDLDANDPKTFLQFENYCQFISLNHWLHHTNPVDHS